MQSSQQLSQFLPRQSIQLTKAGSTTSNNNNNSLQFTQQISSTFAKLHDTIDNLDIKVNNLLQKHEAQFLFAWRNHIKKIKKQLYEIKQKADQKQKLLNSNQRLVAMEKQMALFRDQALKLYQQVEDKKSEMEILRRKVKQQQMALQIIKQQNKQLIKIAKMSQAKSYLYTQKIHQLQREITKSQQTAKHSLSFTPINTNIQNKHLFTQSNFNKLHAITVGMQQFKNIERPVVQSQFKNRSFTINNQLAGSGIPLSGVKYQKNNKMYQNRKVQTFNVRQDQNRTSQQLQTPKKRRSIINKTFNHSFMMIQPNVYDSQLKNWFLQCIKSIKKQIASRKTGYSSPLAQILKVQSLDEFKTIDKLRLLQMFLQNQKLLIYMYQKIFPDRLKQIQSYLAVSNNNINQSKQSSLNKIKQNLNVSASKPQNIIEGSQQMIEILDDFNNNQGQNQNKIRFKPVTKGSKSQPIRNRIMMRDGKLNVLG